MVKTVYFDLGNVLIFFSREKMMKQISLCTGIPAKELQGLFFKEKWLELYETGKLTSMQICQMFQLAAAKSFTPAELFKAASDVFTLNQEIWPLVEELKKRNIRLILLSNTSECHFKRVEVDYPQLDLFDTKILSYEVGCAKPDEKIFQLALSVARCAPHECFYTDDIPEFIASARGQGLPGEIFTGVSSLKAHLILRGCDFLA